MKLRRWIVTGFVLGIGAVTAVVVAQLLVLRAADAFVVAPAHAPERPVAIVLGAGLTASGSPGPVLTDRLDTAWRLYRDGKVTKILVSGDNDGRGRDEVNPMRDWLLARGVPTEAVYMDHAGLRTQDTMIRAASVFRVREAIVCTQAFHIHRAVFLARRAGIDAVGAVVPERRWVAGVGASARETLARARAVMDVALGVGPRHLGAELPIDRVSATKTHDRNTRS